MRLETASKMVKENSKLESFSMVIKINQFKFFRWAINRLGKEIRKSKIFIHARQNTISGITRLITTTGQNVVSE
jgi:hypothetical protein